MNREALDKFLERGILVFVLAILVFGPLAMGAVDAWAFLVIQGLTMGVMFFWVLRIWLGLQPQLLWPPICWVVFAFMIYAVVRYLTADIEYVARLEIIQVLICGFLFFAIVNNLYRQDFSQVISFILIFLATGISSYAVCQFFTHSQHVWNLPALYPGRGTGTYISPNNLAGFLEMILPVAVAYLLVGRIKPVTRILLGYCALVIAAGIVVTFSRGGWAATAIGLLALLGILIFHRQHRLPAFILLVFLLGGGTIFFTKYLTRTTTYIQRVNSEGLSFTRVELELRGDLWRAAKQMWHDHFWLGVGPAHYDYRFREYRSERVQARPDRAHNDYLNLLADWGTTGGIIVFTGMAIFFAGLLQTRKYVRRAENNFGSGLSNRFAFFIGASAGLFALALHSIVDFNLHIPANAILGVTLLALLSSNVRFTTKSYWLSLRRLLKICLTLALAGGVLYLGYQAGRRAHEQFWLARAAQFPDFSPERAALLEKAFLAEPKNFETAYNIGECYRTKSFEGGHNYAELAKTAMGWFKHSWELDHYYGYSYLGYGMCLDWLDCHDQAAPFFERADTLDPNGYFTAAKIGWHYVQTGDYAAARPWLERSMQLHWQDNSIARMYLDMVEQKLTDKASGKNLFPDF